MNFMAVKLNFAKLQGKILFY